MTRIEDKPHFVYKHYDDEERLLYVGMTSRPNERPHETRKRAWVAKSFRVEVSPPMSHAAAVFVERSLIREGAPIHNVRYSSPNAAPTDPDLIAYAEKHGCTRSVARQLYRFAPKDQVADPVKFQQMVAALGIR